MDAPQGGSAFLMSSLENGVMKRLFVLMVALFLLTYASGCSCGRFFKSRGAKCGIPSFRIPKFGSTVAPPCASGGCNSSVNAPSAYPVDSFQSSPGWTSAAGMSPSIQVSPSSSEYSPMYVGKPIVSDPIVSGPVVSGEILAGPEMAEMPTAP